jgi:hypothetical protein
MEIEVKKYNEGIEGERLVLSPMVVESMRVLRDIKAAEQELKERRERAVAVIEEFHFNTGARDFKAPGVGSCSAYMGSNTRFDKAKAALALVKAGVDAELIDRAWDEATTVKVNSKLTVRFKPE